MLRLTPGCRNRRETVHSPQYRPRLRLVWSSYLAFLCLLATMPSGLPPSTKAGNGQRLDMYSADRSATLPTLDPVSRLLSGHFRRLLKGLSGPQSSFPASFLLLLAMPAVACIFHCNGRRKLGL